MLNENQKFIVNTETLRQENIPTGYQKTKYGVIPSDWEIKKVKDILKRVRNPVDVQKDVDYKQIGIRSHGKGIFYKESVKGEELGNKAVFWVVPDCFIVNIVFAWELAVAKTTDKEVGFIASHRFPMYKAIEGLLDLDFITYMFKSPRGKYLLNVASPGGAGRNKTLGQKEFGELEVPIPSSINEQQKIATILTTWDKAIELNVKLIDEKKEQKKALLQNLLTGKIRLPGFNGEWKKVFLKDIVLGKGSYGINAPSVENNPKLPTYLRITDISDEGYILTNGLRSVDHPDSGNYFLEVNDIVFVRTGASTGRTYLYDKSDGKLVYAGFLIKFSIDSAKADPKFIKFSTETEKYNNWVRVMGVRSGQPGINAEEYGKLPLYLPPISEQKAISSILENIDREILLLKSKLDLIKKQKKGLMQNLLTGKVRVEI